jgi:hypothetical protein
LFAVMGRLLPTGDALAEKALAVRALARLLSSLASAPTAVVFSKASYRRLAQSDPKQQTLAGKRS